MKTEFQTAAELVEQEAPKWLQAWTPPEFKPEFREHNARCQKENRIHVDPQGKLSL